jgi:hypothetical protein
LCMLRKEVECSNEKSRFLASAGAATSNLTDI